MSRVEVDEDAVETLALSAARLRQALGYFIADPRFKVTVGGNPHAVEQMLCRAHQVYEDTERS